jgi:hypothetical protein
MNLCHDSEVIVEVGTMTTVTRAAPMCGDARDQMFDLIAAKIPCMRTYQDRTKRILPVIVLPDAAAGAERAPGERIINDEWPCG